MSPALHGFRPSYLLKRYPMEPYPVAGVRGAWSVFRDFGCPIRWGLPSGAIAFRDETGLCRSLCVYFPAIGQVIELRVAPSTGSMFRHVLLLKSFSNTREYMRFESERIAMGRAAKARNFRGEGL